MGATLEYELERYDENDNPVESVPLLLDISGTPDEPELGLVLHARTGAIYPLTDAECDRVWAFIYEWIRDLKAEARHVAAEVALDAAYHLGGW